MQSNLFCSTRALIADNTPLTTLWRAGNQATQVRNHVKMYPWRRSKNYLYSHLDRAKTPYTDKHNLNEFLNEKVKEKMKPWQYTKSKEKEHEFRSYMINEGYTSDPKEARETAKSKLRRFYDSLVDRGSARETIEYNPPSDVEERVLSLVRSNQLIDGKSQLVPDSAEQVLDIDLRQNKALKFSILTKCIEEFDHDVPNSHLTDIETVRDVVEFFNTPVCGFNPYEALIRQDDKLPANLHLIPEPIRFDKETDTFFGGHNALPGTVCKVPGLRAAKKYPILNQDEFQWPDV